MLFGRFLELGLTTTDIAASVAWYERLGFSQLVANDTWSHPYGVLSDGHLCIGLHQRRASSPSLTFVQPGLAGYVQALRATGLEPHFTRLGDDDFHEVELRDPAGQAITVLEARTFSPPHRGHAPSLCGWFSAWSMPSLNMEAVQAWWEHAGAVALETLDEPIVHLPMTSDHLNLALHRPRTLEAPALVFTDPGMTALLAQLDERGVQRSPDLPRGLDPKANALLEAPEGTLLLLLNADP
jgi:catechol 2,3-dioxygenase-like lactoylglutathione lyase family enzyme